MAMYYYASKISAIACGTRCRQTVLQKSRGQRDRDKYEQHTDEEEHTDGSDSNDVNNIGCRSDNDYDANDGAASTDIRLDADNHTAETSASTLASSSMAHCTADGVRYRRRYSEQLDAYDIEMGFQKLEVSSAKSTKTTTFTGYGIGQANMDGEIVQYDIPKNTHRRTHFDVNYESSVLGSGGIMYINGRILSGPLESLSEALLPKDLIDFDKEFVFSFLLSSRLFLRPHELLGKLLSSVPDSESLESLVALLAEWTNKFPYDYRDERMMSHVKHIVARCSSTCLEAVVSEILSALLKRLTDLERHEEDLRACQINNDKPETNTLDCATASQYAQILCRLEKKLAKHIGPEEFLQCSNNILLDKQKKWDQPTTSGGPPGAQDPKKTCNLETYLDWSARLRLFVCNEILRCSGIRDRSKTVELWSGVAQYCLLVGNYNSATAILETLESPPIARLKITWSKLQVTCQQLDCMQRHAEGYGDLWNKQAIVLNESHHINHYQYLNPNYHQREDHYQHPHHHHPKTDTAVVFLSTTPTTTTTTTAALTTPSSNDPNTTMLATTSGAIDIGMGVSGNIGSGAVTVVTMTSALNSTSNVIEEEISTKSPTSSTTTAAATAAAITATASSTLLPSTMALEVTTICNGSGGGIGNSNKLNSSLLSTSAAAATTTPPAVKPNDWVVIPVFADIVKLALAGREDCLQRLPNGHINIAAFDRMAAIVGAFTKHMHAVKSTTEMPAGEYEIFCRHMQKTSKLNESDLIKLQYFDKEQGHKAFFHISTVRPVPGNQKYQQVMSMVQTQCKVKEKQCPNTRRRCCCSI